MGQPFELNGPKSQTVDAVTWFVLTFFSHAGTLFLIHYFGSNWNIPTITGMSAIKFWTDIHGSQTMQPNDFGDPMTFSLHEVGYTFVVLSET